MRHHLRAIGIVAVAMLFGVAGFGVYGAYVGSISQSQGVSSGTVNISLNSNRIQFEVQAFIGVTKYRRLDLDIGSADVSGVTLSTTFSPSSVLNTDATNGLHLAIDACSVPWSESGTFYEWTYTCSGTTTTVLADRAISGTGMTLSNLTLTAGASNHLRFNISLPGPSTTVEGKVSGVTYTFNASQRAATNK